MKKIISCLVIVGVMFSFFLTPKANAYLGVFDVSVDPVTGVSTTMTTAGVFASLGTEVTKYVKDNYEKITVEAAKMAALWAVQKTTQAIIGSGDGGGGTITNWNNYLYVAPQQRAMAQMNSFFTTVSQGRLSSINYEGVGPNYDAYLVSQAKLAITAQPFQTNLQETVTDPSQLFASGNMKGITSYLSSPNNVSGYLLASVSQYNLELSKATEIAKNEQDRGFLPTKKNGVITKPASLMSSAFTQIDQLGTNVIMNANDSDGIAAGLAQIGEGALMSVAAKSLNFATSDAAGKQAIQNKNDQFPFSLAYSSSNGFGFSAGGTTVSSGIGGVGVDTKIGNTAISGGVTCSGIACQVSSTSQKTNTSGDGTFSTTSSGTTPNVTLNTPAITCKKSSDCNPSGGTTFVCTSGTCKAN